MFSLHVLYNFYNVYIFIIARLYAIYVALIINSYFYYLFSAYFLVHVFIQFL